MKIAVIGPGAIGCLFAAKLSTTSAHTYLIDHRPSRAERLNKAGIQVEINGSTQTYRPSVQLEIPENLDLCIICTKAHATESLLIPENTPTLSIQNGLGNIEVLCKKLGSDQVLAGTTSEASTMLDEGHIRHVASGTTTIGPWTTANTTKAVQMLKKAGFKTGETDSPGRLIWEKVIANAGINPLTALQNVPNGQLLESEERRALMQDLVLEATKVAHAEGYQFEQSMITHTETICENTAENISSMLQDVRKGRVTEIDAISGEIIRRADKAAIPVPRTKVIYQLIKGLEQR